MTWYTYKAMVAKDPETDTLVKGASGLIYAITDTGLTTPLDIFGLEGNPLAEVSTTSDGLTGEFRVEDAPEVLFSSPPYVIALSSPSGLLAAARDSAAAAAAARDEAALSRTAAEEAAAAAASQTNNDNGNVVTGSPSDPIRLISGTTAEWTTSGYILADRQPGLIRDPGVPPDLRIGNGVDTIFNLDPISGGGAADLPAWVESASTYGQGFAQAANAAAAKTLLGMDWDKSGNGSPEGVVGGNVGNTYRRLDGGTDTTLYVKESGAPGSNTGWKPRGGVVTKSSLGLGSVDNTPDNLKPVSVDQKAALDLKPTVLLWTGSVWPARPSGLAGGRVWYLSTGDPAASVPTTMVIGDLWYRHPDAPPVV